jgi:two-component system cell cycle sensor histidine kinase PleC
MSEKLRDSFALYDSNHRLVDWDDGFVEEFRLAGVTLKPGMHYADVLRSATADPASLALFAEQSGVSDGADVSDGERAVQQRLADFGSDRSWEYRTFGGRIVRIDEYHTQAGGIRRSTRDVTDERAGGTALLKANQRQDAEDSDLHSASVEIRRNPDGSYVFPPVSEAMRRLLDLPRESVGLDAMVVYARMIIPPEQDARFGAALEHSAETMEICTFEYRLYDGKSQLRWIRQSMMPRRALDGAIVFSGVMHDITREKDAEDQVELLRSVVVRSSDSIAIFETSLEPERGTKILYVNAKFTELFGGSADSLMGQPLEVLMASDYDRTEQARLSDAVLRDDGIPIEYEASGRDGRIFWVEVRVMTVQKFDNGGFRWVVISRDIGERRQAQDALIQAKDAAEAGNLAKSQFLANMSHELRTPLNAIIGFTELIEQGIAQTGWQPSYAEYLADVSGSGRHLLDLINTILDLSKIEAGQLKLDVAPVDLGDLVRTSLALVSGMARDSRIAMLPDIPTDYREIPGDFLKLKQVMLNIFSNAIKFTPPGGKVMVGVAYTATQAVVTVNDTGCGIAEADLERVTQPFVQVGNTLSRKYGGSGLGLSIAQQLCILHGGRLTIRSVEGKGTTVRILLPLGGGTAAASATWPVPRAKIAPVGGRPPQHVLAA